MDIFSFEEADREKLRAFLSGHQGRDIPLCDSSSQGGVTLYLEHRGQVLGIAARRHNAFHPHFEKLYLAIEEHNFEYATCLYNALLKCSASSSPLEIVLKEEASEALSTFLKRHQFALTLTSDCPLINIEKSLESLADIEPAEGFRTEPYSHLNDAESESLRLFRLSGYQKTHYWSPPLSIESGLWQETELTQREKEISWAVLKDEHIVLCSDAHFYGDEVHLGWGWHDDHYEDTASLKRLWARVLSLQLDFCHRSERRLIGECDSLDKYGQYKYSLLSHHSVTRYRIYQQKRPPGQRDSDEHNADARPT